MYCVIQTAVIRGRHYMLLKNYLIDKMYKAKYRHSRNTDKLKQMQIAQQNFRIFGWSTKTKV